LRKLILLDIFFTILFVMMISGTLKGRDDLKRNANVYAACDMTSTIKSPDGIIINGPDDVQLIIPNGTEVHITGVHIDGYVDVDDVDIEISDEVLEAYKNHPMFPLAETSQDGIEHLIFLQQFEVSDIDSEELTRMYDKLCERHENFDVYFALSVILSSFVYLCPVVFVTVRALKKSAYGVITCIVPLLSLLFFLLVLKCTFSVLIG